MKLNDKTYNKFALCREMLQTAEVVRHFNAMAVKPITDLARSKKKLLLTGEGSSRIFPAKHSRKEALQNAWPIVPETEGATQSGEYNLDNYAVLGASNSGRTRELVRLFRDLRESGHSALAAVSAHNGSVLEEAAMQTHVLSCGTEDAVAATKSVVEQALVLQALLRDLNGQSFLNLATGADLIQQALTTQVPESFATAMSRARHIYFAGRNDGVAEELTLKAIEIVRKPSVFLEGTYAAHGIEEVIQSDDVVILVDPFPQEEDKFHQCLVKGISATVIAIADRKTLFPTLMMPTAGEWNDYVLLTGGWNLLVEAGIAAGIDLDKPERARKVGNEVD